MCDTTCAACLLGHAGQVCSYHCTQAIAKDDPIVGPNSSTVIYGKTAGEPPAGGDADEPLSGDKVCSQEQQLPLLLLQTRQLPADRRDLTHLVVHVQNVATPSISRTGTPAARRANGWAGTGRWNKRRPVVTDGTGVAPQATSPTRKRADVHRRRSSRERLANRPRRQSR